MHNFLGYHYLLSSCNRHVAVQQLCGGGAAVSTAQ